MIEGSLISRLTSHFSRVTEPPLPTYDEIGNGSTRVTGEVDKGHGRRENILVVDSDEQLVASLDELSKDLRYMAERSKNYRDPRDPYHTLGVIFTYVKKKIPNNKDYSRAMAQKFKDKNIFLSQFFGHGVCRHQVLLAAYYLDALKQSKFITGRYEIVKAMIMHKGKPRRHTWLEYHMDDGRIALIDFSRDEFFFKGDERFAKVRHLYEPVGEYVS